MKNKQIGGIISIISLILLVLFTLTAIEINKTLEENIELSLNEEGECAHNPETNVCPYEERAKVSFMVYGVYVLIGSLFLFGIYLLFSKEPKEIKKINEIKPKEDKFKIILSALNEDEQKVMNAVKSQDGIKQSTLRIRTDMSKTKLSLVLKDLEKRNLIKKVVKGNTNQVFLRRSF